LTGRASVRSDALIDALPIVGASTKFVGRPQQATSKVITADSRSRRRCSQRCVALHGALKAPGKAVEKSRRCRMKLRFCNLKNTVVQLSKIVLRRQFDFYATERSNSSSIEE
jgi:hypothetical protein